MLHKTLSTHAIVTLLASACCCGCRGSDEGSSAPPTSDQVEPRAVDAVASGMTLTDQVELPASVATVAIPDTEFAQAAAELAFAVTPEPLRNHLMRVYLFGSLLQQAQGRTYDPELAFVASMLHDLGLVEPYISPDQRFELDGADTASKFLREQGRSDEEIETVWEAIALHMTGEVVLRMAPDIAFVAVGAAADGLGAGLDQLSPADVDAVLQTYPRLGFKEIAIQGIIEQCERKPLAYTLHPLAEVGRRHIEGFSAPTVEELIRAAPFAE